MTPRGTNGLFITFEGTEGSGKTTQIALLAQRLEERGRTVRLLREPGGTPIGEEIRHTLKHSAANAAMAAETELFLVNASRAQLVHEVIRPAIAAGEVVLCDRFYDSTVAYQGYGRQLPLETVHRLVEVAVGDLRPRLTILFTVPLAMSEERRHGRAQGGPLARDRMEEADRSFFERVAQGYRSLAAAEPGRVRVVDGTRPVPEVSAAVWELVEPLL